MIKEEIDFTVEKFHIYGTLVKPEHPEPFPVVVFVHWAGPTNRDCYGSYLPMWERFVEQGYACMSWDKPGTGESKGEYDRFHLFQERAKVVREAISFLKKRSYIDPESIGLDHAHGGGRFKGRLLHNRSLLRGGERCEARSLPDSEAFDA